ncbi:hypothetical protein SDC9_188090 [bioreactor metagenome]|uniref:Uncharacterized protein n=1 Tax=bioreactor metagenome TaxID=1076179 RepID=A0A645HQ17_9ZZZZ
MSQSSSLSLPVTSFWLSTKASLEMRRIASCSRLISSEKKTAVLPENFPAWSRILRAMEVLPMPGRAASKIKSDLFRPVIFVSSMERPVDSPGSPEEDSLISLSRSSTSGRTCRTGTMLWAPCPRRMEKIFCSAASNVAAASPPPSCTMAVISDAAWATARKSALFRTMAAYSITFAAVGVISISWARYARVVFSS